MDKASLTFDRMVKSLEHFHSNAKRECDEFAAKVATAVAENNLSYVLSWGQSTFKSAPMCEHASRYLAFVRSQAKTPLATPKGTMKMMLDDLNTFISTKSRHPEFSSSPTSNLVSQYALAAAAEIREHMALLDECTTA